MPEETTQTADQTAPVSPQPTRISVGDKQNIQIIKYILMRKN